MQREEDLKAARERGNQWRKARGYALLPDLRQSVFADHMTPIARWFEDLDNVAAAKVTTALYRLEQGNYSNKDTF